jgi:hypothetical protein
MKHKIYVCIGKTKSCFIFGSSAIPLANARGSENFGSFSSEPRALASGTELEPNTIKMGNLFFEHSLNVSNLIPNYSVYF